MSLEAKVTSPIKELKTGVHLVTIMGAARVKGLDKKPVITKDGEAGVTIRFTDHEQKSFDKTFWVNGPRDKEFTKMMHSAQADRKAESFSKEVKGKRLWIYIREVYDIMDDDIMVDKMTGEQIVNYYIFDYSPCFNPENRPAMSGDPFLTGGRPEGKFISYNQVKVAKYEEKAVIIEDDNFPDIPIVKQKKPSALTPNNDFVAEVSPKTEKSTDSEIDWDDV